MTINIVWDQDTRPQAEAIEDMTLIIKSLVSRSDHPHRHNTLEQSPHIVSHQEGARFEFEIFAHFHECYF